MELGFESGVVGGQAPRVTDEPARRALRRGTIPRRELFERLAGGGRVTAISASAGSGKTTLLRAWVAESGLAERVGWVSVQPEEHDAQLREPLSESETRILRYLPTNLSAPEIGDELYVAVTTVKTHIQHIYAKLGAHRRAEAVERARGLGLLAPSAVRPA